MTKNELTQEFLAQLISDEELGELTGASRTTRWHWRKRGLRFIKVGAGVFHHPDWIKEFVMPSEKPAQPKRKASRDRRLAA